MRLLRSVEQDDWKDQAACARDPEPMRWFPGDHDELAAWTKQGLYTCWRQCPVRRACLARSLEDGEQYGTWGGVTQHLRRQVLRAWRRATPENRIEIVRRLEARARDEAELKVHEEIGVA